MLSKGLKWMKWNLLTTGFGIILIGQRVVQILAMVPKHRKSWDRSEEGASGMKRPRRRGVLTGEGKLIYNPIQLSSTILMRTERITWFQDQIPFMLLKLLNLYFALFSRRKECWDTREGAEGPGIFGGSR
nr:SRP40 carboxy-terminal domain protein [Ipomoea batatas]